MVVCVSVIVAQATALGTLGALWQAVAVAKRKKRQPREQPKGISSTHWRADGAAKASYASQGEAMSAADERRWESGVELSVYRCGFCSAWHLGQLGSRQG
jgi:Ni/Co efflux regulator RcnB